MAADVLAAIVGATRRIVEVRSARCPAAALERAAAVARPRADAFRAALSRPGRRNVIAECKRRSPARGVLRQTYDPAALARQYAGAGAAAVSVLTEPTFFDGALDHLRAVRAAVALPVLRKDFVVDAYQLLEARAIGADAVLLIVAALSDGELRHLLRETAGLGLAALVEVHDRDELERGLACGASIIGVNSRDLRTLEVRPEVPEALAARMPEGTVAVAESGLHSAADLARLERAGYQAFLIGEALAAHPRPGEKLGELLQA